MGKISNCVDVVHKIFQKFFGTALTEIRGRIWAQLNLGARHQYKLL